MSNSVNFKYGSTTTDKNIQENDFVAINAGFAEGGNTKYGSIYKGDKILGTTEANNLVLTSEITIAGGPLEADGKVAWSDGVIPAGTSMQDIMMKLFCVEKYPTTTSFSAGSAKCTIAAPSFTLGNSGATVEVGTKCTLSNVTISAAVPAANAYPKVTGFTYGYSAADDNTRDNSATEVVSTVKTAAALNSGNYQLAIDYTGFNSAADESATANADYSKVVYTGKDLIATVGTNSVKATVTGPTASITYNDIPSYFACSNLKNTRSGANVGEGVFHKSAAKTGLSYTSGNATNNGTLSVTAKYKYFAGYTTATDVTTLDSAAVRALTGIGKGDKFLPTSGSETIIGGTSTATTAGKSVVIAIPATYRLSVKEGLSGEEMIGVSFESTTVSVKTGEINTDYKVYMYPITSPTANISIKNVVISK